LQGEGGRAGIGGPYRHRIQTSLVTAQVALTCVLLVGAGLLIRSFYATQTVELGFNPNHLFKAGISLTSVKYESDDAKTVAFWDELITKVRQIPGITDAATNDAPPLAGHRWDISPFSVDGQPKPEPGHEPVLTPEAVSSGYFRTMQIPIIQGRDFNAGDTSDKENVVIVDTALAQHFFPGQNPIGKSIRIRYTGDTQCTIVGVVPYVCDRTPGEEDIPFQSYQPYAQVVPGRGDLIIRSDLSSSSLASAVRQVVSSIDPGIPIYNAYAYNQMIAEQFVTRRLSTLLVALFSGATLFLSAVGLYGILSYFLRSWDHRPCRRPSPINVGCTPGRDRSLAKWRSAAMEWTPVGRRFCPLFASVFGFTTSKSCARCPHHRGMFLDRIGLVAWR
jgi:putative ABC transport system permease protein